MDRNKTLGIGETSSQTKVSERQLRHWEEAGYINPEKVVCGDRAYRRYSPGDINFIKTIKTYLDQGFKLRVATNKAKIIQEGNK